MSIQRGSGAFVRQLGPLFVKFGPTSCTLTCPSMRTSHRSRRAEANPYALSPQGLWDFVPSFVIFPGTPSTRGDSWGLYEASQKGAFMRELVCSRVGSASCALPTN